MPAHKPIKACVFDAYGTLFDLRAPAAALSAELGERAGDVSTLWRTKQLEYTWLRSLMGQYRDFAEVTADSLDFALAAYGLAETPVRGRLLSLFTSIEAYRDAAPCLASLKAAGARTGILSNGSPAMLAAAVTAAKLGGSLDYILSADSVRIYKPSPEVYRLAPNAFGVEPGEIAFVSANAWDCSGAAAFGFHVIHVNRFHQVEERLGAKPAAEAANLAEAAALIEPMLR